MKPIPSLWPCVQTSKEVGNPFQDIVGTEQRFGKTEVLNFKEEGRGTRNGHEASKGSKGISGL